MAKGYTQDGGLNFNDTLSPIAKLVTIKVLITIAAANNWHITQLDVNNAFPNGNFFEEIYMELPMGYREYACSKPEG